MAGASWLPAARIMCRTMGFAARNPSCIGWNHAARCARLRWPPPVPACASRSSRRITLSPANSAVLLEPQDQPAARQPQTGSRQQIRRASRQCVRQPQRYPQYLRPVRTRHIQQQPGRAQERRLGIDLVAHGDRHREERPRVMVQPDPRLTQHPQERLLGAELRMIVAADVGHPARRLAQPAASPVSAGNSGSVRPAAPAAARDHGRAATRTRCPPPAEGPRGGPPPACAA